MSINLPGKLEEEIVAAAAAAAAEVVAEAASVKSVVGHFGPATTLQQEAKSADSPTPVTKWSARAR